jgi:exopolysaccharide biosynthesis protein
MNCPPGKNRVVFCLFLILLVAGSVSQLRQLQTQAQTDLTSQAAQKSPSWLHTQSQAFQTIATGVEYLQITRGESSPNETTGPWLINMLRVDPTRASLQVFHALDEGVGMETTSSMAARHKAVAAINGGYFRTTGTFRGESVGLLMLGGKLISEPHYDRAAVGLITQSETTQVILGHLRFVAEISVGGRSGSLRAQPARREVRHGVNGLNRPLSKDELVVFTPEFHKTTLTTPDGAEAVVRSGSVLTVRDHHGSSEIPADGFVVSAVGDSREWLLSNVRPGARISFSWRLTPLDPKQEALWRRASTILGGGPQLIKDGKVDITNVQEKVLPAFRNDRHPRTAIARLTSGKLLLLTVDGRQPGISVGMSLDMVANLLLEFGADEAINLDGGGSTTMVVRNKVVNRPSDSTGERPVSDAILVFAKSN